MTLVTVSNTVTLNPQFIASIVVNDATNRLMVRMHDGEEIYLPCQYGKSIWVTRDDLVKAMNEVDA